jgi:putative transposase
VDFNHKGFYKRGKLPHFDQANQPQFITYRLADSLPNAALRRLMDLPREKHTPRILQLLDEGAGNCHLANHEVASMVQDNLLHFDQQRYNLLAWAIMPNHVHVLMHCLPGSLLPQIVHSLSLSLPIALTRYLAAKGSFGSLITLMFAPRATKN